MEASDQADLVEIRKSAYLQALSQIRDEGDLLDWVDINVILESLYRVVSGLYFSWFSVTHHKSFYMLSRFPSCAPLSRVPLACRFASYGYFCSPLFLVPPFLTDALFALRFRLLTFSHFMCTGFARFGVYFILSSVFSLQFLLFLLLAYRRPALLGATSSSALMFS